MIYVKAFLIHFLFLYSFKNETFINKKKQPSFSWKRDLGGHEDDFLLGVFPFCAIINAATVTGQQNGSYLYIIY